MTQRWNNGTATLQIRAITNRDNIPKLKPYINNANV